MKPEDLAYWYLRLNGFFTILNYVLHPDRRGPQRTDADITGVRFPNRAEFPEGNESDEADFCTSVPLFLITEVKTQECQLNGPWTSESSSNVNRLLASLGVASKSRIPGIAKDLYARGWHEDETMRFSLACIGQSVNSDLLARYRDVPQKTWSDVIRFVARRFRSHRTTKTDHEQWHETGKTLWNLWDHDERTFEEHVRKACSLPPPSDALPSQGL